MLYEQVLSECAEEYVLSSPRERVAIVLRFAHAWLLNPTEAELRIRAAVEVSNA